MSEEIVLVATLEAKEGKAKDLKDALVNLIEPTRKEAGCLSYTLNEDLNNSNVFTMLEKFKSQEALDVHFNMPYFLDFKNNILGELAKSITLNMYKEVNK